MGGGTHELTTYALLLSFIHGAEIPFIVWCEIAFVPNPVQSPNTTITHRSVISYPIAVQLIYDGILLINAPFPFHARSIPDQRYEQWTRRCS